MKAKIFRRLIAPVMSLFALAACDHEFDDFHGLPDYSYFRTGFYESSFAADSSSSAKTEFEYRVWAEAATKMRRAEITLEASLENVNTEVRVENFVCGEGNGSMDYQALNSRQDQNITVTDSLMLYRIRYDNFTLEYRMPFQSAFYNDGKTAGQMAYLRFAPKVVDNGYKLTDLDSETIDGKVFTRKLFRHSISVRFNGRDYQATATVVLKRQAGADGEDFVVKSTLLDSGIRDLKNEGNHASYVSWLKIRQDFDSGKKDTVTFEVLMYGKLSMQPLTEMNITGTKLVRESAGFDKSREHVQVVSRDKFVEASYYERYFVVHYNYGTTSTLFQHAEAVYNDGFTSIDFPCIKYTDIKNNGALRPVSSGEDDHGSYGEYEFAQWISATFKSYTHSERNTIRVFLTE